MLNILDYVNVYVHLFDLSALYGVIYLDIFYLQIYNEALIVHSNARASDALCYILQNIQDLQISDTGTEIEIRAKTLFESQYHFQLSWPSFKKKRLSILLEKMLTICNKCAGIKKMKIKCLLITTSSWTKQNIIYI